MEGGCTVERVEVVGREAGARGVVVVPYAQQQVGGVAVDTVELEQRRHISHQLQPGVATQLKRQRRARAQAQPEQRTCSRTWMGGGGGRGSRPY